jgi:hypothetical protein
MSGCGFLHEEYTLLTYRLTKQGAKLTREEFIRFATEFAELSRTCELWKQEIVYSKPGVKGMKIKDFTDLPQEFSKVDCIRAYLSEGGRPIASITFPNLSLWAFWRDCHSVKFKVEGQLSGEQLVFRLKKGEFPKNGLPVGFSGKVTLRQRDICLEI